MKDPQDLLSASALTAFRLNGQFLSLAERLAEPAGLTATRWQVLGAVLDSSANERGESDIGAAESRVALRVVRTNEEAMIARATHERLASHGREFAA